MLELYRIEDACNILYVRKLDLTEGILYYYIFFKLEF